MSTALIQQEKLDLPIALDKCIAIAYDTIGGKLISAEDIAVKHNLAHIDIIKLLTNPFYMKMVNELNRAIALQGFNAIATQELISIIRFGEKDSDRINAAKTLADILGINESKKRTQPTVQINIDKFIREQSESSFIGL